MKNNIWTLNEDIIKDYFIDFIQNKYDIYIDFGFVKNKEKIDPCPFEKDLCELKIDIMPAYFITLEAPTKFVKNVDLKTDFEFVYDNLKYAVTFDNIFGANIFFYDEKDELLDIELKDIGVYTEGFYITINNKEKYINVLKMLVIENKKIQVTCKTICDFYDWKYDKIIDGVTYDLVSIEELADCILTSNCSYKDELIHGFDYDEISDSIYYEYMRYYQKEFLDIYDDLNEQNQTLIINGIIKEIGLNKIIKILNDNDVEIEQEDKDYIHDLIIDEPKYIKIIQDYYDTDTIRTLIDIYISIYAYDLVESYNKELFNEFENIVQDIFDEYKIIEKIENGIYKKYFLIGLDEKYLEDSRYYNKENFYSFFNFFAYIFNDSYNLEPDFRYISGYVSKKELNKIVAETFK